MKRYTFRAKHFAADLIVDSDGTVLKARAPLQYLIGWQLFDVMSHADKMSWSFTSEKIQPNDGGLQRYLTPDDNDRARLRAAGDERRNA